MLAFTLDTYGAIAAVTMEPDAGHIDRLVRLARAGHAHLAMTTRFEVDQRLPSDERRQTNLDYLSQVPVLELPGLHRFDSSAVAGGGAFVSDDIARLDESISRILLPAEMGLEGSGQRMNNVRHLISHRMAGHDVFITGDDHLIRNGDRLRLDVGIVVATLPEAVALALGQSEIGAAASV